ncbi:unnamed protein product [Owenia fusiformis]|uniref:Uncharacterized protein n=1 Tax=Owenia fusiformis TaxID=6347 RepID=A0A8J1TS11_OWEFU|nr:unnamed protein product [Owenia fusiformis]
MAYPTSILFSSPKRADRLGSTGDSLPGSPPIRDIMMLPWNWAGGAQKIQLSPSGSLSSVGSPTTPVELRRGRPRSETIKSLIVEGSSSPNVIKCQLCNRVFPREKSLQAHLRTHTGERPYKCDYPACGRAFCQSGQLKTHQRLHTGEKPFICSVEGCTSKFAHANRHCASHPFKPLKRAEQNENLISNIPVNAKKEEVIQWLERQAEKEKTPLKATRDKHLKPKQRQLKRELDAETLSVEHKTKRQALGDVNILEVTERRLNDANDKWLGAMALMELAGNPLK